MPAEAATDRRAKWLRTFPAEGCRYGLSGAKADPKVDLWEPWLELLA